MISCQMRQRLQLQLSAWIILLFVNVPQGHGLNLSRGPHQWEVRLPEFDRVVRPTENKTWMGSNGKGGYGDNRKSFSNL